MLGGADNPNGELPSYITGADRGGPGSPERNPQHGGCPGKNPEMMTLAG